jgi:hypothetical protein
MKSKEVNVSFFFKPYYKIMKKFEKVVQIKFDFFNYLTSKKLFLFFKIKILKY